MGPRRQRSEGPATFEPLEARLLLDGTPIISEFMADNSETWLDQNGDASDWIEIYNPTGASINLLGWHLSDDIDDLDKWAFPAETLDSGEYLLVFASATETPPVAGQELHTNFALEKSGGYLALTAPGGLETDVVSSYTYGEQETDVSFGVPQDTNIQTALPAGAPATALVPTAADDGLAWTARVYDDSGWLTGTTGVGFDNEPRYRPLIGLTVSGMYGVTGSVYIRVPFEIPSAGEVASLTLRMKYDDGFVAFLNGEMIKSVNGRTLSQLHWNSTASANHGDDQAEVFVDYDLTAEIGHLVSGTNVLAIQGLNYGSTSSDLLILPELVAATTASSMGDPAFLADASPGWANTNETVAGFVGDTHFSADRGFFDAAFQVAITCDTLESSIYYTTDGTAPSASHGTLYTAPLTVSTTTTLRAVAVRAGWEPSDVDTETYIFLDDILTQTRPPELPTTWGGAMADYDMDPDIVYGPAYSSMMMDALLAVPTMSLVMDPADLFGAQGIYTNTGGEGIYWERAGSLEMILTDGSTAFQENAGVRIYGGVGRDASVGKHSFRILFKDIYGDTRLHYQLFEDSAVDNFNTFVLRANFNDAWPGSMGTSCQYIRDQWASYAQLAMGDLSHHSNFVHLYVNGMYWGLYNPTERPDAAFLAEYEGGEQEQYDALNSGEAIDGDRVAWDAMVSIANGGLSGEAQYAAIQQYLDVQGLADYCLLNHYMSNWDWDVHNWYAARKREAGAQYKMFSWDAEWTVYDGVLYNDYTGTNNGGMPSGLFYQLLANQDFKMLLADRVYKFCFNDGILTPASGQDLWMQLADPIDLAIVAESARWGDHNRSAPYTRGDWLNQQNWVMNTWFPARTNILLGQYRTRGWYPSVDAAVFSKNGGMVPSTYGLTMTGTGTIYYTTDGSDPRVAGGGVSATAHAYTGAVEINGNTVVRARVLSGATWSAMHEATFMLDSSLEIRVSEIMYNPAPPTVAEEAAGFTDNDDFQYLELVNIGDEPIGLGGMTLSEGITCTLASLSLAPGARAVVVRNEAAFLARYGAGLSGLVAGTFEGKLGGEGDRICLGSILGDPIQDFEYKDGWYGLTDGSGFSLVVRDAGQELALWGTKQGWRTSWQTGGNPGAADAGYDPAAVVINEVLAHQDVASGDWIELHNTSASPVPIGGWYLSDDAVNLMKYRIAAGTVLEGGAYLVLTETDNFGLTAPDGGRLTGFALSELGDDVFLTSVSAPGVLGGYREDEQFGATLNGVTLGRYIKSTGGKDFVAVLEPTPWGPNAAPVVGPVVINEILYDPAGDGAEFIELVNLTASPVALHDNEPVPNPWKFTQGITYVFPTDASIPAYGYALVVPIDPAAFRATYGIAPEVPIYGPYAGLLDNAGETLELSRPGVPEPITGFVPYVREERVTYDDAYPWPDDVAGFALMRLVSGDYGNDVANWMTSTYGGTPGEENEGIDTTPPSVPAHLRAQGLSATSIELEWDESSDPQSGVAGYRVYRGGVLLGETTGTTFVDTGVVTSTTYSYQVSVWNTDGAVSAKCDPLVVRIFGIATVSTPNSSTVWVTFSEAVTASSAEVLSHYRVTHHGGTAEIPVTDVSLQTNYLTVELTLGSAMVGDIEYTVTITDVVAQTGIAIVPNSTAMFGYYQPGSGTILRQYWLGIPGQDVSLLTSSPDYPATPSGSEERSLFEASTNWADEYGARMVGYVHPPVTGQYVFWIAADDEAELWLSTDADPTHKVLIAYVPSATNPREWTKYPANQQSVAITLSVGQRYYIEAIQKEGTGSDHLAVGWRLPDGTLERPIPGSRLSPYSPPPPITVSLLGVDRSASETGPNPGAIWVNRVGDKTGPLTVTYTVGGTATSADYVETLSGTIVIPAGASYAVLAVTPVDDHDIEGPETVVVSLLDAQGYKVGIRTVTITIADNDPEPVPTVSLVATDAAAAEAGQNPGTFTVSRVGDTTAALTVHYSVGGTAGTEDYSPVLTGSVVIEPGASSVPIVITPADDDDDEPDETVTLTLLADAEYAIGTAADTVTIADNDLPMVSVVATDPAAAEAGQDPGTFTVSRVGDTTAALTVYYTVGGTASAADYTPVLTGSVVIEAGASSAAIVITPVDDDDDEPDETVTLALLANAGYVIDTGGDIVTIIDDEVPTVSLVATDAAAAEAGQNPGTFTVSRVGDTSEALTVYYTIGGTAGTGDYSPVLTGSVVIEAGASSAPIVITPADDGENEPDETVTLTLLADAEYAIGAGSDTVTIIDNEVPQVTAVLYNRRTGRTVSSIEPSGLGVRYLDITFDEAVTFTAGGVAVQKVTFDGDTEILGEVVTPASVTGSGTAVMTLEFTNGSVVDTWVKVTLGGGVTDVYGHALDGEAKAGGSGRGYIYKDTLDLPTGDGTPGGDAIFYVGSLRGDMRGAGFTGFLPDGKVDVWDINGFTSKYTAGNLDADMRGAGFTGFLPDGLVNVWDINGFTSFYSAAVSAGKHLDALPTVLGGPLASGLPSPLAPVTAEPSGAAASAFASSARAAPADVTAPADVAAPSDASAPADVLATGLTVASEDAWSADASAAWSPAAGTADVALDADAGIVDLLALPSLEVALGA